MKEQLLIKVLEMLLNSDSKSEPEVLKFSGRLGSAYSYCFLHKGAVYKLTRRQTGCNSVSPPLQEGPRASEITKWKLDPRAAFGQPSNVIVFTSEEIE